MNDIVIQHIVRQEPVLVDQFSDVRLVIPLSQNLLGGIRRDRCERFRTLCQSVPFRHTEGSLGNVIEVASIDRFHHFRQCHGLIENVSVRLK